MKRREFITLLGGAAAWPATARAQQSERVRRVGVLVPLAADDPQSQRRITAFVQGLEAAGWTDGRNIRIDIRWTAGDADRMRGIFSGGLWPVTRAFPCRNDADRENFRQ